MVLFKREPHRSGDLLLGYEDRIIDVALTEVERVAIVKRDPSSEAVGECRFLCYLDDAPGPQALRHRRPPLHRYADQADARVRALKRNCDPGDQPSPGHGDEHALHIGEVLQYLQAECPLASDDIGIVERIDPHQSFLALHPQGYFLCLIVGSSLRHKASAVTPYRSELVLRDAFRDADCRLDPQAPGDVGDGTAVVAARHGDDPPRSLLIAQAEDLVRRSPQLERTGCLQALRLQHDLRVALLAQPV